MRVASNRLIDAAAELAPGDRALLSLLVNHGLDDGALARVMHATPEEIETRRARLAERLGTVLSLPSANVQEALAELAGNVREHRAEVEPYAAPAEQPADGTRANSYGETAAPAATVEAAPPQPPEHPVAPAENPRRRGWVALVLALLVVVLVIVIASSGGTQKSHPAAAKPATPAPSAPRPAARAPGSLAVLPGGRAGVSGAVAVIGSPARPQLKVTVSGLPAPASGGYELWLYNSVIDSVALAHLGASASSVTVALPADYRKYRWLDVSLQPAGAVNHSGESLLRAAMPR